MTQPNAPTAAERAAEEQDAAVAALTADLTQWMLKEVREFQAKHWDGSGSDCGNSDCDVPHDAINQLLGTFTADQKRLASLEAALLAARRENETSATQQSRCAHWFAGRDGAALFSFCPWCGIARAALRAAEEEK